MKHLFCATLLLICLTSALMISAYDRPAYAWEAVVEHVSDGDSFVVRRSDVKSTLRSRGSKEKIRLYGIDAPERGQAFSRVSRDNLHKLLQGTLDINVLYHDKFGRAVALVKSTKTANFGSANESAGKYGSITVNEIQIRDGMAWMYSLFCKESFCPEWKALENDARSARKGLWRDAKPIPPWDWKRR